MPQPSPHSAPPPFEGTTFRRERAASPRWADSLELVGCAVEGQRDTGKGRSAPRSPHQPRSQIGRESSRGRDARGLCLGQDRKGPLGPSLLIYIVFYDSKMKINFLCVLSSPRSNKCSF